MFRSMIRHFARMVAVNDPQVTVLLDEFGKLPFPKGRARTAALHDLLTDLASLDSRLADIIGSYARPGDTEETKELRKKIASCIAEYQRITDTLSCMKIHKQDATLKQSVSLYIDNCVRIARQALKQHR